MKEYIITTEKGANQQLHELIRCRECKHRPYRDGDGMIDGDYVCPYLCDDPYYAAMPEDDWFCHRAERIQHD